MKIRYRKAFLKAIDKLANKKLNAKIKAVILEAKQADDMSQIRSIKKLRGYSDYYRIRIGDYRIGIEIIDNDIFFSIIAHRKDIYKKFP